MLIRKRTATFAVMIAAAIVPSLGAQAADARPAPVGVELCQPKWVVGPYTSAQTTQSMPSTGDLDVENATPDGDRDLWEPETVQWDDLSYDGC